MPSVTVSRSVFAPDATSSTLTPGRTPPVSSATVPVTVPVPCANAVAITIRKTNQGEKNRPHEIWHGPNAMLLASTRHLKSF